MPDAEKGKKISIHPQNPFYQRFNSLNLLILAAFFTKTILK